MITGNEEAWRMMGNVVQEGANDEYKGKQPGRQIGAVTVPPPPGSPGG